MDLSESEIHPGQMFPRKIRPDATVYVNDVDPGSGLRFRSRAYCRISPGSPHIRASIPVARFDSHCYRIVPRCAGLALSVPS
jgi:hypothetical protein